NHQRAEGSDVPPVIRQAGAATRRAGTAHQRGVPGRALLQERRSHDGGTRADAGGGRRVLMAEATPAGSPDPCTSKSAATPSTSAWCPSIRAVRAAAWVAP